MKTKETGGELIVEGKPIKEFVKENGWVEIDGWLVDPKHVKEFREQNARMVQVRCTDPRCKNREYAGMYVDPLSGKGGLGNCLWCGKKNEAANGVPNN